LIGKVHDEFYYQKDVILPSALIPLPFTEKSKSSGFKHKSVPSRNRFNSLFERNFFPSGLKRIYVVNEGKIRDWVT
jgi:hypothetical protein